MQRIRWYGPSLVLLLTVLGVMLVGPTVIHNLAHERQSAQVKLIRNDLKTNPLLEQLSNAYVDVARSVEPSVAHIEVSSRTPSQIRDWFFGGQERPGSSGMERFNPPTLQGNGAGWVYDDRGHIITNNHVVSGGDLIIVRFSDGSRHEATIVGTDPRTDVAVLKVGTTKLVPAKIAEESTRQGEIVFAFGSPFKFEFSMSQGIVSAKGRRLDITGPGGYENFIQTDAEINPGNSGGPLVNIYGQVVGMNTAIASSTGQFAGLGFAIPVKMVKQVADELIAGGTVHRGYLGVYIDTLTPTMAKTFDFQGDGVLVNGPIAGSPADKAGLRAGDIITAIEGTPVTTPDELRMLVAGYKPGHAIKVTYYRDKTETTVDVTLARLPDERTASLPGPTPSPIPGAGESLIRLGVEGYETFTPAMAQELGWQSIEGVAVTRVRRGSTAALQRLFPGVIITHVMGSPIVSAEELEATISTLDLAKPVRLTIAEWNPRDSSYLQRFVVVDFPIE